MLVKKSVGKMIETPPVYGQLRLTHRLIEMRDTIVTLMEMHHFTSYQNLLNHSDVNKHRFRDTNLYMTIENETLFDCYLEMIQQMYAIDEARSISASDNFDMSRSKFLFCLYKYLYDPVLMNYVEYMDKQEDKSNLKWDPEFIKYVFVQVDDKLCNKYLFNLRNQIFMIIDKLLFATKTQLQGIVTLG